MERASLNQTTGTASGVVLSGGRSSRFGEADKLMTDHGGMPLLHHAVLRLAEVTGDVVVVLAPDAPEPAMPPGVPVRYARDAVEGQGPLAGAVAGLAAVTRDLGVLAGGDMPGLSTAVVLEMLRVAGEARADAVALQEGDGFRPLPVVVHADRGRERAHSLLHEGQRSLRAWLQAMRVAVVDEATWTALDPARSTLRDIDVPGDLRQP
ncbi:MAG: molybdenum cofactor guanylyltransferase [Actinomycetota bacterium]|nr:molybdenum cofactor guanylyltransferase [Actinomycetota bacterium]